MGHKLGEIEQKKGRRKFGKNISRIKFRFWYDLSHIFSCLNPLKFSIYIVIIFVLSHIMKVILNSFQDNNIYEN